MIKTYDFDEVLAELGPEIQEASEQRYQELIRAFPLSALRVDAGKSQVNIGSSLGVSQAAISKMESRSDMLLSTVHRYVKALGGEVRISISVGDRGYLIEPANDRGTSFVLQKRQRESPVAFFAQTKARNHQVKNDWQDLWQHKGHALSGVSIGDQVMKAVANDHECFELRTA